MAAKEACYIKHSATWQHGKSWLDESERTAAGPGGEFACWRKCRAEWLVMGGAQEEQWAISILPKWQNSGTSLFANLAKMYRPSTFAKLAKSCRKSYFAKVVDSLI